MTPILSSISLLVSMRFFIPERTLTRTLESLIDSPFEEREAWTSLRVDDRSDNFDCKSDVRAVASCKEDSCEGKDEDMSDSSDFNSETVPMLFIKDVPRSKRELDEDKEEDKVR